MLSSSGQQAFDMLRSKLKLHSPADRVELSDPESIQRSLESLREELSGLEQQQLEAIKRIAEVLEFDFPEDSERIKVETQYTISVSHVYDSIVEISTHKHKHYHQAKKTLEDKYREIMEEARKDDLNPFLLKIR